MQEPPKTSSDWRKTAVAGYAVIIFTFGIVGGWAAVAELDRAVIANATVAIESNRKVVQHFEGGIVQEVFVREGQEVEEGQVLFRLEGVQAKASMDLVRNQLESALVMEARLIAERDQKPEIEWPEEIRKRADQPVLKAAIADQTTQFRERRSSLQGQIGILQSRIEQISTEIQGLAIEQKSTEEQAQYIKSELEGLRVLRSKDLIPVNRLLTMERERTRLEGAIGRLISDQAKAQGTIGESKLQIQQLQQKFQEEVAAAILEVRQKIADAREKITVANDVLQRTEIKAPRAGTVQSLKVFTVGQVIRSGEPLLEIVPKDERLIVQAHFSPTDIDSVHAGQEAEIRFPAFHAHTIPVMIGKLETVSHDRLVDEATKEPYYLGLVTVNKIDIPEELQPRIRAGMPAEVIVASGQRTVINYMVSPLANRLRKSFTEQ